MVLLTVFEVIFSHFSGSFGIFMDLVLQLIKGRELPLGTYEPDELELQFLAVKITGKFTDPCLGQGIILAHSGLDADIADEIDGLKIGQVVKNDEISITGGDFLV